MIGQTNYRPKRSRALYYGRFPLEKGRWLMVCPAPSILLAAAARIQTEASAEELHETENGAARVKDSALFTHEAVVQ